MKRIVVLTFYVIASASVRGSIVAPTSYTFDQPTSTGSWGYHDPNFTKLTDGVYGTAPWSQNQGVEWDGWLDKPVVNIDFSFNGVKNFNKISVGTVQDGLWDVAMPNVTVYSSLNGGVTWTLVSTVPIPPSSANDNQYRTVVFNNLNVSGNAMRIALGENGPWTFTDEITFESAVVPEPTTCIAGALLLLPFGLQGIHKLRNRKQ